MTTINEHLFQELLWVAKHLKFKPGWAFHAFNSLMQREPSDKERVWHPRKLTYGTLSVLIERPEVLNPHHFDKLVSVLENRNGPTKEQKQIKKDAWRELEARRPRWSEL